MSPTELRETLKKFKNPEWLDEKDKQCTQFKSIITNDKVYYMSGDRYDTIEATFAVFLTLIGKLKNNDYGFWYVFEMFSSKVAPNKIDGYRFYIWLKNHELFYQIEKDLTNCLCSDLVFFLKSYLLGPKSIPENIFKSFWSKYSALYLLEYQKLKQKNQQKIKQISITEAYSCSIL